MGDRVRATFMSGHPLGTVVRIDQGPYAIFIDQGPYQEDRAVFVRLDAQGTDAPYEVSCQYDFSLELYRTGLDEMLELL